ncbi:MAG: hypothetical protein NT121_19640 [Chloroflexi bacterium]|nr:hypothetical protein [Chloroflexota bacterium]
MNKFISLAQLIDRRARTIQDPPTKFVLQKVRLEVAYYLNGGGERSLVDINTTPQEAPVWLISGFGYAPVRENDDLEMFAQ